MIDLDKHELYRSSVDVNENDLQGEFRRVSADLAYWTAQYAHAVRRELFANSAIKRVAAELSLRIRADAKASDTKLTEAAVEASVRVHEDMTDAEDAYADACAEKELLRGVCEAVRTKRDMLQSLGALIREELKGDPTVYQQQAGRR